jgi:hypothetical protein
VARDTDPSHRFKDATRRQLSAEDAVADRT